ncbi:PASTA domain-containing protein [Nonomuraea insulae]|uniref:PASTA domain-containing protein n=1 Tax=Nonomuraea insulae TaxID=1616787 RepID=A0ABW1CJL6_9ACTN
MTIEDDLADAMSAHVAGVRAEPGLAKAVRRRRRAHVVRFRAAGAALLTAAVAVAVPVAMNPAGPANPTNTATGQDRAVIRDDVTVPDVTGKSAAEAARMLRDAGLVTDISGAKIRNGIVLGQSPRVGAVVAWGSHVAIKLAQRAEDPQDLGDLGDGRAFGGIRLGYLPEGLVWGRWSAKDRFGEHSYTTSFAKPDADYGVMSIQVFVFEGKAARQAAAKFPEQGAESVDIGGRPAWLASVLDGGEAVPHGTEGSLLTIGWVLRDDLAVEVCLSPDYAKEVDGAAELKRIAEGIRATK